MATRIVKIETIIKNQMQSYINQHGIEKDTKFSEEGNTISIVAPNRFGPGYVRIIFSNGQNWAANLSEKTPNKVCAAQRYTHLENFFSKK